MKAIAFDLHRHQCPEIRVMMADGAAFDYDAKSVVMVCRPCHGEFTEQVIERAIACKAGMVLYVGLHRNVADDLGNYLPRFEEVCTKAGTDGESIWRMDNGKE